MDNTTRKLIYYFNVNNFTPQTYLEFTLDLFVNNITSGTYTAYLHVDFDNKTPELNETNNSYGPLYFTLQSVISTDTTTTTPTNESSSSLTLENPLPGFVFLSIIPMFIYAVMKKRITNCS